MTTPFDQGRAAARRGESRRSNPFDRPDRQPKGTTGNKAKVMANDRIAKYMRVTAEFTIRPAPGVEKTYYPDDTIQVIGADFGADTVELEVGAARRCHCMPLAEFLSVTVPTRL